MKRSCANCGHGVYEHGSTDGCKSCSITYWTLRRIARFCRTYRERKSRARKGRKRCR